MTPNLPATGRFQILPALHKIQHEHGFLKRDPLERFSKDSGIPLHQFQEVASFFPHFRLSPPAAVTVRVCRDMACHLAGAASALERLRSLAVKDVCVEGVSCLGRCDRAPAVCISTLRPPGDRSHVERTWQENECFYLGRDIVELERIVRACADGDASKEEPDRDAGRPQYPSADWIIDPYKNKRPNERYEALRTAVAQRNAALPKAKDTPPPAAPVWSDALLAKLDKTAANLRGMGGAGILAADKWRDVRNEVAHARKQGTDDRAFVVVNADESEPATFKDRELLLHYPHLILEGLILAGLITDASEGFIYIRHEYHEQIDACKKEIDRAESMGLCGSNASVLGRPFPVSVFTSPGGYICGEQSALIEAMSGKRGEPRNLPPKLETNGLDDMPTLVSNVETYAWAPYILMYGGMQYSDLGVNDWQGRRFFSVCGDVKRPGVYEVPMGLTLRDLIHGNNYCQGIAGGRKLKAVAPSGPSGGFLPAKLTAAGLPRNHTANEKWRKLAQTRGFDPAAQELDILDLELELDLFRALSPTAMLGAGITVYDDRRNMAEQAVNALEFYRNESCGKCVPCRVGSQKLANFGSNLLAGRIDAAGLDNLKPLIMELIDVVGLTSICGLGRSIPMPVQTLINFFHADLDQYLRPKAHKETAR